MIQPHRIAALGLAICVLFCASAFAQDEPQNLFANGNFARAGEGGAPAGWDRRSADSGFVRLMNEDGQTFVRIGVEKPDEDSHIQQTAKLPEDVKAVAISVRLRHQGIEPGEKGHMTGFVQGKWTAGGKEIGKWVDVIKFKGNSDGWIEAKKGATRPAEADGLMLRVGMYKVKAGHVDVSQFLVTPVTAGDIAADRAKYRPTEPYGEPVSDARYNRLTRGVNINNWFCQPWNIKINGTKGGFNAETFRAYITDHDLKLIREAGFDHIRLPVDPLFLWESGTGALKTDLLPEFDRAIEQILSHDLAVIIDVHPKSPGFKGMSGKTDMPEQFVKWWGQFAKHLSKTDPERVFLELMNEPGGQGYWVGTWEPYQDRLIMTVRENAPRHTLIANGGAYMLIKELPQLNPHPDRNIIYAIHYYEPSPFTHQGAVWMKDWYRPLRNVPWPLTSENVDVAVQGVDAKDEAAEKARSAIKGIASSGWGSKEKIQEHVKEMAAWSKAKDRRLVIGEWGVYTKYAPRADRLRYLDFMTRTMKEHGIGWSKWDYCGAGFDIVSDPAAPSAKRELDAEVIKALNLK